ncbi:MAG: hypothetical protein ACRD44_01840 [Bryobacteraceae bacterium]
MSGLGVYAKRSERFMAEISRRNLVRSGTAAARGCAFGDFDNDGDIDVLINCVNDVPQLLRCDSAVKNNWLKE